MFFRKKKKKPEPPRDPQTSPGVEAMKRTIAERERDDPLLRAHVTQMDIVLNLSEWLKDERGLRVETILGALGALAGFAAVVEVSNAVKSGKLAMEMPDVVILTTGRGEKLWFGNRINHYVAEDKYSLWSLVAGKAQHMGATLPDIREIFEHTAAVGGTDDFAVPRLPAEHMPGHSPVAFAKHLYPQILPILTRYDLPPQQHTLALAIAACDIMDQAKGHLDPGLMTRIVMECAIPASKLDPDQLLGSTKAA
ncbi:MAG: hypothetical protein CSA74_01350 [Rhodobacterales bacterium]|nr:MAG: hypothetical protein CSA74_01350 [Rhodobacterales bacterium]